MRRLRCQQLACIVDEDHDELLVNSACRLQLQLFLRVCAWRLKILWLTDWQADKMRARSSCYLTLSADPESRIIVRMSSKG